MNTLMQCPFLCNRLLFIVGLRLQHSNERQIPVLLCKINAIPDNELIRYVEALVLHIYRGFSAFRFIQQCTE